MLYSLKIDKSAGQDLQAIGTDHPAAKLRIAVLLQELKASQDWLDRLTENKHGSDRWKDRFHVQEWTKHRDKNVWRVKEWPLENMGLQYRIVYVFLPKSKTYVVLGIAHRQWDYSDECEFGKRMLRRADELQEADR